MRTVYQVNAEGYYLEDVRLADDAATPADAVESQPPAGMLWPRRVAGVWTDAGVPYTGERDESGALIIPDEE